MASYTPNLNLYKPDNTDDFKDFREKFNDNMDILDESSGGADNVADVTVNGTSVVDPTTKVAEITMPTKVSDLTNDVGYLTSNDVASVAMSGDYDDLTNKPSIPTKTSDLTNDSDFVSDASYVHTDNNFTTTEKSKLSGIASGAEVNVQSDWSQTDNTKDDFIKNKPSAENKSATTEFNTVNGGLLQKCIINLEPVQSGSGTPSPDNVRPISGHTEVDVLRCGKNLFSASIISGYTINSAGVYTRNNDRSATQDYIPIKPNTIYTLSYTNSLDEYCGVHFYDANKNYLDLLTWGENPRTFTSINQAYYVRFSFRTNTSITNPQLELGSTATSYEPYKGNLYQIQIGQTVYGGSVDAVTGVMTVTHICETVTGGFTLYGNYGDDNKPLYRIILTDYMKPHATVDDDVFFTTNRFTPISVDRVQGMLSGEMRTSNETPTRTIYLRWDDIADVNALNTYLSTNPLQICGELDTPITIQLTPQQISTLIGKNYLSAPLSGQTIDSIEYRDVFGFDDVEKATSVKVPISLLGTDEFTSTASKAYSAGDYFYKDGMMCKALTSIAKGATLTLNTNYSASTLADILKILSQ